MANKCQYCFGTGKRFNGYFEYPCGHCNNKYNFNFHNLEGINMNKLTYKITSATNKEGLRKELPSSWIEPDYMIYMAKIGRSAILQDVNSNMNLTTSKVEDISIWGNAITITTMNTVYTLESK